MRRLLSFVSAFLTASVTVAFATVGLLSLGTNTTPAFVGFLDTYATATWGFSAYKLTGAYSGNWGTIMRQSDSTTLAIGFLPNGKVNVAAFNTFCAGTNCYATSLVDQVNGINASQATLANMPRVIVNSNSLLSVCPQPGTSMATAYNAAVNTAKQHLFAVAQANYFDSRYNLAGVPTTTVTGNVNGTTGVTSLSSQAGISAANNGGVGLGPLPGVVDTAGLLVNSPSTATTGQTYLAALPTGSTATLGTAATGTQNGDTLTFTNAALGGPWIINGPSSSTFASSAYWGFGIGTAGFFPSDAIVARNAVGGLQGGSFVGQGMRGQWSVYDVDTSTTQYDFNGVSFGRISLTTSDITYSTNVGMTLFSNASGSENLSQTCFETMVLFPATQASRVAMAQFLMAQDSIAFPFAPATSDGFAMTGVYFPNDFLGTTNVYGQKIYGPDVLGQSWVPTAGAYAWPSVAFANNITNSTTMWRFIVEQGDSDTNITDAERSELAGQNSAARGGNFSIFYQFEFEQYVNQTGNWCFGGQVHYAIGNLPASPDAIAFSCLNNQIQFYVECCTAGSSPAQVTCGSPISLVQGTVYAVEIEGFWSSGGSTDTIVVHAGVNGSSLPQLCSLGPTSLFSTVSGDTPLTLKQGIYRGFPWTNPGTLIMRSINAQLSSTANSFAAYITSQPPLPTH